MTNDKTPEHKRALEATEKMVAAYAKDLFAAERRGYERGKAEAEKRIWAAAKDCKDPYIYLPSLEEIIFGGGDVD